MAHSMGLPTSSEDLQEETGSHFKVHIRNFLSCLGSVQRHGETRGAGHVHFLDATESHGSKPEDIQKNEGEMVGEWENGRSQQHS